MDTNVLICLTPTTNSKSGEQSTDFNHNDGESVFHQFPDQNHFQTQRSLSKGEIR